MVTTNISYTLITPAGTRSVSRALAANSLQFIAEQSSGKISEVTAQEPDKAKLTGGDLLQYLRTYY